MSNIVLEKMNVKNELVEKTYEIFKDAYKSAMRPVVISEIINGEQIDIKPNNILITDCKYTDKYFEQKKKFCTKKLYKYQENAILKIRDLEHKGYYTHPVTKEKVVSNGWNLSLPIGSGKSIIFEFLSIFYREIKPRPIIISRSGKYVPLHEQLRYLEYPYYYENCGYILNPVIKNMIIEIDNNKYKIPLTFIKKYNKYYSSDKYEKYDVENNESLEIDEWDIAEIKNYLNKEFDAKELNDKYIINISRKDFKHELDVGNIYYDTDESSITVFDNYEPRKTTVILTHAHLIDQMIYYFGTDFKQELLSKLKIYVARDKNSLNIDANIILCIATEENVKKLVELSYDRPFMRIIVDDYTSMQGIDSFRQILAISTLFVSGSGFNRDSSLIPQSYYTLKYSPVEKISIVGKPEETYEGVIRNNIAIIKLLGSMCDFSSYQFVHKLEEICRDFSKIVPMKDLYPDIDMKGGKLRYMMALYYVMVNKQRIKKAIYNVDRDYNVSGKNPNAKYAKNKNQIKYFIEWYNMMNKTKNNPLLKELFSSNYIQTEPYPMISQTCMSCRKEFIEHEGWGCVATCCGAFFCDKCLKNMCTHELIDSTSGLYKKCDSYYCSCCRYENPVYYLNMSKKKDKAVYGFNLIDEFFDKIDLPDELIKFDYYYYMLLHGLVPLYKEGKKIDLSYDISQNIISKNIFESNKIKLEAIYSRDQLMIKSLDYINKTIHKLNIDLTNKNAVILFYKAPEFMHERIKKVFSDLQKKPENNQLRNLNLLFINGMDMLIGLHRPMLAIIQWEIETQRDSTYQLIGRIYRLNNFNIDLNLYIMAENL